jgi:hypothetical protein
MLIPRFSLRTTLKIVTVCALLFLVAGQALEGKAWAVAVTVAVLSVLATLAVHGCFFGFTAGMSRLIGARQSPALTGQGGLQLSSDLQVPPPRPVSIEPDQTSTEGTPAEQ